jgi:tRNA A37 threonylcarbamoyladenosine synthetase subunit TsaC/SUA5/YrdC
VLGIISLNADLIYNIKKRHRNKKLIRFVDSTEDIKGLTNVEKMVLKKY